MEIAIITALLSVAALALLFFLAKRAVKLVVRLALAGVLILIVLLGLAWWYGSDYLGFGDKDARPTNTRRANSR